MEKPSRPKRIGKLVKLAIRIIIPLLCLWYVSTKIQFGDIQAALAAANWGWLALAAFFFILSKVVSAVRLNIYFSNIKVHLDPFVNLRLYWLGMFYNLFLPGAISGDAYKVIRLGKKYDAGYRKLSAAVLLDRFSGLLGLGLILAGYGLVVVKDGLLAAVIVIGAVAAVLVFFAIVRFWMTDFRPGFWPTLFLGLGVQGCQVVCAYLIMAALGIPLTATAYIFLFLASSMAAVLPLSINGLGIREIVFVEGARYFGLTEENSLLVLISLLFYVITLVVSLFGGLYVFRDPLANTPETKKDSEESLNL